MRWPVLFLTLAAAPAQEPGEIIRKSVAQRNWERYRDYTYLRTSVVHTADGRGGRKRKEHETHEVLYLYGEPYARLVARDGQPLGAKDERKEQEKMDKLARKREKETPEQRQKRLAEFEREREKEWRFLQEIPEAYDFTLLGSELVDGTDAWVIGAEPRPGFRPRESRAGILKKFRGRLWIDKKDYQWVKLDAEVVDTVSWGLVLARLNKGTQMRFEQMRVNGEVWLPRRVSVDIHGRLALLKKLNADVEVTFENYRKFQTDSRVVAAGEAR